MVRVLDGSCSGWTCRNQRFRFGFQAAGTSATQATNAQTPTVVKESEAEQREDKACMSNILLSSRKTPFR